MLESAPAECGAGPEDGEWLVRRLAEVHARIQGVSSEHGSVRIVAVTKGFDAQVAHSALLAGLTDLGESYEAELVAKARQMAGSGLGPRWHFIGAIQRNKVRSLAPHVCLWHGVTRAAEGAEIARWAPGAPVLVQVSLSPDRRGVSQAEVPSLVGRLGDLGLDVRGLMAVGPSRAAEEARPGFRSLAKLGARLGLPELSMGMSSDLEVAVSEGATIVRLGQALFGPRPEAEKLRECSLVGGG